MKGKRLCKSLCRNSLEIINPSSLFAPNTLFLALCFLRSRLVVGCLRMGTWPSKRRYSRGTLHFHFHEIVSKIAAQATKETHKHIFFLNKDLKITLTVIVSIYCGPCLYNKHNNKKRKWHADVSVAN